jgi:hypothetical protein
MTEYDIWTLHEIINMTPKFISNMFFLHSTNTEAFCFLKMLCHFVLLFLCIYSFLKLEHCFLLFNVNSHSCPNPPLSLTDIVASFRLFSLQAPFHSHRHSLCLFLTIESSTFLLFKCSMVMMKTMPNMGFLFY